MSSFPLPDNSGITSSREKPRRNVEHSTLPFSPTTTSRSQESFGPEPKLAKENLAKLQDKVGKLRDYEKKLGCSAEFVGEKVMTRSGSTVRF